jgi:signal peptidase I
VRAVAALGLAVLVAAGALMFVPAALGYERYVITGGSMGAALPKGSIAFEKRVPVSELRVGDVVTYTAPGSGARVTHRIASIGPGHVLQTRGDANAQRDPWRFRLPHAGQPVVRFHVPLAGYVLAALAIRLVRMLVIGLPALLIAVASFRRAALAPAVLMALLVLPGAAHAGTYTTVSCGDPDTHRMTGRSGFPPGWGAAEYQPGSGNWDTPSSCSTWGSGFGLGTNAIGGRVPYPQWGRLYFAPPADTSVDRVRVARALRRANSWPYVVPMLATSPVDWCHIYWSECTVGNFSDPGDPANVAELGSSAWFELYCDGGEGCARDGWGIWKVFGARITLRDDHDPVIASVSSSGGAVTVRGSDRGGGLLRAEVLAGDRVLATQSFDSNGRCETDFHTDLVPCPLSGTRTLAAGAGATRVRLVDVAGNATSYSIEPAPVAPALESRDAWLNAGQASAYGVAMEAPGPVAGYAVTHDGSEPGTAIDVAADADGRAVYGPPPGGWPDGRVVIRARTISTSGLASEQTGSARIRVDRSAPVLTVAGAGNPGDWQPAPVTISLGARDSGSGMGAAEDDRPVESGAYIAYTLDGRPLERVGGDEAAVEVPDVGPHTLTFRAYDAAGNVSADRTVTFRLGRPDSVLSDPGFGFWARTANPATTFTAAPSFADGCPGAVTLTPSRDTYVDEGRPHTASGSAPDLVIRSAAAADARALLAFDLPAPEGCHVASASLVLHPSAPGAERPVAVYRASGSWDEDTTWATRPGTVGPPATPLDVTALVRGIYAHGDDGLIVRDAAEGAAQPAGQSFGSADGVAAQRPQLVVRFE